MKKLILCLSLVFTQYCVSAENNDLKVFVFNDKTIILPSEVIKGLTIPSVAKVEDDKTIQEYYQKIQIDLKNIIENQQYINRNSKIVAEKNYDSIDSFKTVQSRNYDNLEQHKVSFFHNVEVLLKRLEQLTKAQKEENVGIIDLSGTSTLGPTENFNSETFVLYCNLINFSKKSSQFKEYIKLKAIPEFIEDSIEYALFFNCKKHFNTQINKAIRLKDDILGKYKEEESRHEIIAEPLKEEITKILNKYIANGRITKLDHLTDKFHEDIITTLNFFLTRCKGKTVEVITKKLLDEKEAAINFFKKEALKLKKGNLKEQSPIDLLEEAFSRKTIRMFEKKGVNFNTFYFSLAEIVAADLLEERFYLTRRGKLCLALNDLRLESLTNIEALIPTTREPLFHLNCSFNNLETLTNNMFNCEQLKSVEKLNLEGSQIATIEPEAFNGLENVQKIDLAGNSIENLDPTIFEYLPHLGEIDITDNPIVEENPTFCAELEEKLLEKNIILIWKTEYMSF